MARGLLYPSGSLPNLRQVDKLEATSISAALRNLQKIYCPLPTPLDFRVGTKALSEPADSGYVSETEPQGIEKEDAAANLRSDTYERDFAVRWLTSFISSVCNFSLDEDVADVLVDEACSILEHLTQVEDDVVDEIEDLGMVRCFTFNLSDAQSISVELNDTPMQTGEDHTDVGLQTWGASIALSEKISKDPAAFRLDSKHLDENSRVVELGAGTGLISLFLSRLLPNVTNSWPNIIATDYHPTVLSNLEVNIASHMAKDQHSAPLQACLLDWSAPSNEAPLDAPADMLIAADVTYAPEHAVWLRDCAVSMLADTGVFWLMVSVRPNGKFAGISGTVEAAFQDVAKCTRSDGRILMIASMQRVEKKGAVGRADEVGYELFEIIWA